ncbi:MAG: hypothetical protein CL808_08400 [Citromicrobium sp.]|nr:hypothetical protein [Citromicrobium sp.]
MRSVFAGGIALVLAACGGPVPDAEETELVSGEDIRLQPGLYRTRISLGGAGEGGGAMQYADDNECLTPADVSGGYRRMLLDMQGRDSCRFESFDLNGEELDAVMICAGDEFQPETEARISGTLTPTATDLRLTVAGFEDGAGGVDMRVTSERIGDCSEGAE